MQENSSQQKKTDGPAGEPEPADSRTMAGNPEPADSRTMAGLILAAVVLAAVVLTGIDVFNGYQPSSPARLERKAAALPMNAPIAVFADRPTIIHVRDAGIEDGDVIAINGVTVNLLNTPADLIVPPGMQSITVSIISEGKYPPCTAGVISDAGGVSYLGGRAGESYEVPLKNRQ